MEIYLSDTKWCGWNEHIFFSYVERNKKINMNVSATRIRNERKRPFYTLLLLIWLHCKRNITYYWGTIDIDLMWSMTSKYLK